ncbi:Precursor of CEP3 [Camellia lanceoleosa]|uniref:Precursor of CEP3 n=1 Tax=Camellia lanceoleosa TaxID=1840588 RepID=A0ACC0I481_9ERIC|nr:Precursor of CEP3 [Camellia lanceoleosa]
MAQIKLSSSASILLIFILFQCIQSSEGRNLKLIRKNESPKLTSHSIIFNKETNKIAAKNNKFHGETTNTAPYTDESVAMAPLLSPPPPSQGIDRAPLPPPTHVNDFRPTAPGNSPGVGHSIQN